MGNKMINYNSVVPSLRMNEVLPTLLVCFYAVMLNEVQINLNFTLRKAVIVLDNV